MDNENYNVKNQHVLPQYNMRQYSVNGKHVCGFVKSQGRIIDSIKIKTSSSKNCFYDTKHKFKDKKIADKVNTDIDNDRVRKIMNFLNGTNDDIVDFYDFIYNRIFRSFHVYNNGINRWIEEGTNEILLMKNQLMEVHGVNENQFNSAIDHVKKGAIDDLKLSSIPRMNYINRFYYLMAIRDFTIIENKTNYGLFLPDNGFSILTKEKELTYNLLSPMIIYFNKNYCFYFNGLDNSAFERAIMLETLSREGINSTLSEKRIERTIVSSESIIHYYNEYAYVFSDNILYGHMHDLKKFFN